MLSQWPSETPKSTLAAAARQPAFRAWACRKASAVRAPRPSAKSQSRRLVRLAQRLFGSSAAQAARGSGSSTSNSANLGPTLGGAAPTAATTMGFPAAGIGAAPGGGVGSTSTNGTTIGQATIAAPPTNPDVPA